MSIWRLMDYYPEPGLNPVRDWYEEQEEDVQAEFDFALRAFIANEDWTEASEVLALGGRYVGLYEVCIEVFSLDDRETHFRAIGAWRQDSRNFILFLVSELSEGQYEPPLERAFERKVAWEKGKKGEIYDHQFY